MSELLCISSQQESSTLVDENNKIHAHYQVSRAISSFNAAGKEAIEIGSFKHLGVSKDERLVNKCASLALKRKRRLFGRTRYL
jgi:hypothetical protein